jgi:hypothetical protein
MHTHTHKVLIAPAGLEQDELDDTRGKEEIRIFMAKKRQQRAIAAREVLLHCCCIVATLL